MRKISEPETFLEAVAYFSDADRALEFVKKLRWPDGIVKCPTCGREDANFLINQRKWQCKSKHPQRQFSVKVGTVFEDSPLGLEKWLPAMWMLGGDRNGTSSCELARKLGITQKSAWFMEHRIRLAMKNGGIEKLSGSVEADETYIGGKTEHLDRYLDEQIFRRNNKDEKDSDRLREAVRGISRKRLTYKRLIGKD